MILQALKEYYDRKAAKPESQIAPLGFEWKDIPYVVVLNTDGQPVALECTCEGEGKKRRAKRFLVPQAVKRSNNIAANLLWDNVEYCLGLPQTGKQRSTKKTEEDTLRQVANQHAAFCKRANGMPVQNDEGLEAVRCFLAIDDKRSLLKPFEETLREILEEGANLTFKLAGQPRPVLEQDVVQNAVRAQGAVPGVSGVCLITGKLDTIERLHPPIKGVSGAQSTGANIVSFNLDAFRSFGREQGANAPVGKSAAFAYTTALNHLLARDSRQKLLIGDATTVFWAAREEDSSMEQDFAAFFGEPPKDDPDRGVNAVAALFRAIEAGAYAVDADGRHFYVLGLAPNASRIAVRFWIVDTVAGMACRVAQHFTDLRIIHGPKEKNTLSLFQLLASIVILGNGEKIPPNLAGDTMRAILTGLPYPHTLLQAAVRRNRAEQGGTYARASLIKACINRSTRYSNNNIEEELKMSLDPENANIGYRLGRLFSVLEKIQGEANPGINATIRDRYYGAASGTPVAVFGTLMKLKNHHMSKLENPGRRIYFERLIGEILNGICDFPAHLALDDQGRFAIGYYHQAQDFYTRKSDKTE